MKTDIDRIKESKFDFIQALIGYGVQYETCGKISAAINSVISSLIDTNESSDVDNGELPPLTMSIYGNKKLLEEEIERRTSAIKEKIIAYKIEDTDGFAIVRLAEHIDPRRLIAVKI